MPTVSDESGKMNQEPQKKSGVSKTTRHFPWAWIGLVAMLCIPVFFVGSFLLMPAKAIREADQGFRKAKQTIDAEALRSWALDAIKRWPSTNGSRVIANSEIPENIRMLYSQPPGRVFIRSDAVEIDWGGALFHWGFEIGSTNFLRPFNSGNHECPYNFEWKPGIYYSREANWKLQ